MKCTAARPTLRASPSCYESGRWVLRSCPCRELSPCALLVPGTQVPTLVGSAPLTNTPTILFATEGTEIHLVKSFLSAVTQAMWAHF